MKMPSLFLSFGSLLLVPASAMASMTSMMNGELAGVSGQGYVVQFGTMEKTIPDLTQRNIPVVSDQARAAAMNYPIATNIARQTVVAGANTGLTAGKTAVTASVATVPGVGTFIAPVVLMLPTPRVSFQ